MPPLLTAWAIVAATIGVAVAAYRVLSRLDRRHLPIAGPDPRAVLALEGQIAATEWLVCHSPACAHLETPHRRTSATSTTCTWCSTTAPAPATPKETPDA